MVGQEASFGVQKVYPLGPAHSLEVALHLPGCFRLRPGYRQIREPAACCFGIERFGGYQ